MNEEIRVDYDKATAALARLEALSAEVHDGCRACASQRLRESAGDGVAAFGRAYQALGELYARTLLACSSFRVLILTALERYDEADAIAAQQFE